MKFPTAVGADEALQILERLQREEAIRIHDGESTSELGWRQGWLRLSVRSATAQVLKS